MLSVEYLPSLANASSDIMEDIATVAASNSTGIVMIVRLALCMSLSGFQ